MTPILGSVLAVTLADRANLLRCLGLVITGAVAVIAAAWLVGLAVDEPVLALTNSQAAARVSPRLIDLLAALATGAVGSIALARDDISDTLPGVAIAISLVPPLAVVGLALEAGATREAFGALLLFITNVSAILAMGLLVMTVHRVSRHTGTVETGPGRAFNRRRATAVIVGGLAVISVPLALTSGRIASTRSTQSKVQHLTEAWATGHGWEVISVDTRPDKILVRVNGPLPEPETASLAQALDEAGLRHAHVTVELIPTNSVDLHPGD